MENNQFNPPFPIYQRMILEAGVGFLAGLSISPFITIVDKGVTQNASGAMKLVPSMISSLKTLGTKPLTFMKRPEQIWILSVYSSTYATNNCVDSFCKNYAIPHEIPKLCIVFTVNMTMSILKDQALAQLFGTKAPAKVPKTSFILWGLRDVSTVLCAFIIPSRGSQILAKRGYNRQIAETQLTFWSPIVLQIFTTPLHLLGLDWYNNPSASFKARMLFLQNEYFKTLAARMMRMTPAYGIGGVANLKLRQYLFGNLDAKKQI